MQENTVIGELIIKYVKMKLFFCLSLPLLASVQTQQNNDLYVNMPDPKSQIQQRDQFTLLVHKMRLSIIQFKKDALLYTQKEDFDAIKMAEMVRAYLIQMDKMLINFDLSSNSNVILSNLSDWDFHPLINFPYIEASCWKSFFKLSILHFLKKI